MKAKTAYAMGRDVTEAFEKAFKFPMKSYKDAALLASIRAQRKLEEDGTSLAQDAYELGRSKYDRTGEY